MLDWRTIRNSRDPKFMVKGHELESCIPSGFLSRFRIVSVRTYDVDRYADVFYRVYDAETVTDADVRAGKFSQPVANFDTLEETLAAIEPHRFLAAA